jgi:lipopolysaccharide transport protein LptA
MRRLALLAAPALAAVGLAVTAAASAPAPPATPAAPQKGATGQAGSPGGSNEPIDVTSDNYDYQQPARIGVYTGNVEVIQGLTRLRTPKLSVYYAPKDPNAPKPPPGAAQADVGGQVERMEAVHYTTPTERALGDHGTYIADGKTIILTGNVVLVQDKDVATGDKLVIERESGHSVLTSNPGKTTPQRVRAVLYPQNQNQNQNQVGQPGATAPKPAAAHP